MPPKERASHCKTSDWLHSAARGNCPARPPLPFIRRAASESVVAESGSRRAGAGRRGAGQVRRVSRDAAAARRDGRLWVKTGSADEGGSGWRHAAAATPHGLRPRAWRRVLGSARATREGRRIPRGPARIGVVAVKERSAGRDRGLPPREARRTSGSSGFPREEAAAPERADPISQGMSDTCSHTLSIGIRGKTCRVPRIFFLARARRRFAGTDRAARD
jgi:hypothetical protein